MTTVQPNQNEHDVICHMEFDLRDAAGRSDYDGRTYYFCSDACRAQFDRDPEAALRREDAFHAAPASSTGR